jgi:hypothetical protein
MLISHSSEIIIQKSHFQPPDTKYIFSSREFSEKFSTQYVIGYLSTLSEGANKEGRSFICDVVGLKEQHIKLSDQEVLVKIQANPWSRNSSQFTINRTIQIGFSYFMSVPKQMEIFRFVN